MGDENCAPHPTYYRMFLLIGCDGRLMVDKHLYFYSTVNIVTDANDVEVILIDLKLISPLWL